MNILEKIQQTSSLAVSSGTNSDVINDWQKKLCAAGAAPMPISYANFLKTINGIYGNNISIFGVATPSPYEDVLTKNTLAGAISSNMIFLGNSLTEYLCYDWQKKAYIIIDKATDKLLVQTTFLQPCLEVFLKNYI